MVVRFGSVDVSYAVSGASMRTALNEMASARFELAHAFVAGQPLDYAASLHLGTFQDGHKKTLFNGSVTEAEPMGETVEVSALALPALVESYVGFFEGREIVHPEVVHLLARVAGVPEENIHVEGLDEMLPLEAIEVIVPLQAITLPERMRIGQVTLLPREVCLTAVDEFSNEEEKAVFRSASAFAVVTRVGRRLFDAEIEALAEIDVALAWLTVRARYGLALMPSGRPQPYRRRLAQARPRRTDLVLVRGITSGRRWLRSIGAEAAGDLVFDVNDPSWRPPAGSAIGLQDRLALLAAARAANSRDQLERVQAIWEAIEFYVAGVQAPKLFDKAEAKKVRRAIPEDVDPALGQRALDLLGKINDPPLMAKLKEAIRRDGVPLAAGELDLLSDLRTARNHAVHGRTPDLPLAEEVDHAVSVVARMLLYRLYRRRPITDA